MVRHDGDQLRVSAWRGDPAMAQITPSTARVLPGDVIESCVARLVDVGYSGAFTSALSPAEQQPFLEVGFSVHEHLSLLRHDLAQLPDPASTAPNGALSARKARRRGVRLRRARRSDRAAVLSVDAAAFNPFWQFDYQSLVDAKEATPSARFRVAVGPPLLGYAVTGRAGGVGYLQRLAVSPDAQGRGVGTALVIDSLTWAMRHGATTVLVNTQETNLRALRFYEWLGFETESEGLAVLHRTLPGRGS